MSGSWPSEAASDADGPTAQPPPNPQHELSSRLVEIRMIHRVIGTTQQQIVAAYETRRHMKQNDAFMMIPWLHG